MATALTPANLKALFDANPGKYKTLNVLPDGYSPTGQLENLLVGSFGTVVNPTPAPKINKPFTMDDILGALSAADQAKIIPLLGALQPMIDVQNRAGIASLMRAAVAAALITQNELDAMKTAVAGKIDDPTWPANIPAPTDLFAQFGLLEMPRPKITETTGPQGEKISTAVSIVDEALGRPGHTFTVVKPGGQ